MVLPGRPLDLWNHHSRKHIVNEVLDNFRFDIAAGILYEFLEPVLRLYLELFQAG